jgi:hypothetical protein
MRIPGCGPPKRNIPDPTLHPLRLPQSIHDRQALDTPYLNEWIEQALTIVSLPL